MPFSSRRSHRRGRGGGAPSWRSRLRRCDASRARDWDRARAASGSTGRSPSATGANELDTRPILPLADRERGRARRHSRGALVVTGSKSSVSSACANMRVDERGVDRGRPEVGRENRRFRRAALRRANRIAISPGLEPRAGDHGRNRVEDAVLGIPQTSGGSACWRAAAHVAPRVRSDPSQPRWPPWRH